MELSFAPTVAKRRRYQGLNTDYDALPLVLEVKDIQNILGISRTTAYALVKQPDFPTFRSGNRIKISKQALFDWMAGGAENAGR